MNSAKEKHMNEIIHETASKFAAMSKVMSNDIKSGYAKLCCIWIENGSKTATAFSHHIGCATKIERFCQEAENDYNECIELTANHAGLMHIQYANGYALVTSKNYDEFLSKNGRPISEDGEWKNFEYINWKNVLPEMAVCSKAIDHGKMFDPKLLVILDNVKKTCPYNDFYASVQERMVCSENTETCVAAYPEMILVAYPIKHGSDETSSDPSIDMKEEYRFFKD